MPLLRPLAQRSDHACMSRVRRIFCWGCHFSDRSLNDPTSELHSLSRSAIGATSQTARSTIRQLDFLPLWLAKICATSQTARSTIRPVCSCCPIRRRSVPLLRPLAQRSDQSLSCTLPVDNQCHFSDRSLNDPTPFRRKHRLSLRSATSQTARSTIRLCDDASQEKFCSECHFSDRSLNDPTG